VIEQGALDRVIFPKPQPDQLELTGAFRIDTVSGDFWTADLVGADQETFLFFNKRFGRVRVRRDAVYTMERREHPNLVFASSRSMTDWQDGSGWQLNNRGQLETHLPRSQMFRAVTWPERLKIDLALESTKNRLAFILALGNRLSRAVRLETWVDELVVVQGTRFEPVLTLENDQKEIRLRLVFDGVAGVLTVFDSTGRALAKLDGVQPVEEGPGLFIRNRGDDLSVQWLRVCRQVGEVSRQPIDPSRPRVDMVDGQVVYGRLFVGGNDAWAVDTAGRQQAIDLKQVDRIVDPAIKIREKGGPTELSYVDGAVMRGSIQRMSNDQVTLQTAFSQEPVTCSLAGASLLRLGSKAESEKLTRDPDQLDCPQGNLQGQLSFAGKGASLVRWKPQGAVEPVRLAPTGQVCIQQTTVSREPAYSAKEYPDTFHLNSGEILPCRMESWDEQTVRFQSPFTTVAKLDSKHVKGIEFSHGSQGFRDPLWQGRPAGVVQPQENRVRMAHNGHRIWHPTVLADNGVRFDLNWGDLSRVTFEIRAYAGERTGSSLKPGFSLHFKGKEIHVSSHAPVEMGVRRHVMPHATGRVSCLIRRVDDQLHFWVNGTLGAKSRLPKEQKPSPAFSLTVTNVQRKEGEPAEVIQIDRFEVIKTLAVEAAALDRALTVPRFNRDNPQSHVLVARTGDLLRGRLTAINRKEVQFVSKGRALAIPTERVSHVVDVRKPDALQENTAGAEGTIRVTLTHGPVFLIEPIDSKDGKLTGRSPIYGVVTMPVDCIRRLSVGGYETTESKSPFHDWVVRAGREPEFSD